MTSKRQTQQRPLMCSDVESSGLLATVYLKLSMVNAGVNHSRSGPSGTGLLCVSVRPHISMDSSSRQRGAHRFTVQTLALV